MLIPFDLSLAARIVAMALALTALPAGAAAPLLRWALVATHPHDPADFTQGLVWHEGRVWESTGHYGASAIAEKNLRSGKTTRRTPLPADHFGEGLALHSGAFWQLTWREGVLHRYDLALNRTDTLRYQGEGWGLTSDGTALIVSDGSANLIWFDPLTRRVTRRIAVQDDGIPVPRLNELEWVEGAIYANVWMTDRVARIDPATGTVTGWLDLAALKKKAGITPAQEAQGAVLNGIAWRSDKQRLLVTGKWWPRLYEIRLLPEPAGASPPAPAARPAD